MIFTNDFFTSGNNYPADNLVQLVDSRTNENVNFRKTTLWYDGTLIDDTKINGDEVIYRKKDDNIYYVDVSYLEGKNISMNRFIDFFHAFEVCKILDFKIEIASTVNLNAQTVDLKNVSIDFGINGQFINGKINLSDNYITGYENHFLCTVAGTHSSLPIEFFGVSPNNTKQQNSQNISNIISRKIQFNFSGSKYCFSDRISYNGSHFIGNGGTFLSFPDSSGIVLDRDFKSEYASDVQEGLKHVSWKKFKSFKIKSKYEAFNFHTITDKKVESFNYCQFHDLEVISETSCFYSSLIPTDDTYSFCYANDFKNIIASSKVSIFENIPLTVITSIDNLHDIGTPVIFKNCLMKNLLCQNMNMGYSLNIKHIIFNDVVESNFQRIKFVNCNFEQMVSNAVVNICENSIFNISFENCYIHYGTEKENNDLPGNEIFNYNAASKKIEKINYVLSEEFYPIIGYNLFVKYINGIYDPIVDVPNKNDLLMTITVNTENVFSKLSYCDLDQYNLVRVYRENNDIVRYHSEDLVQRVFNVENDWSSYKAHFSRQMFSNLLVNSLNLNKTIINTYNSGEFIEGSNIVFESSQDLSIDFDRINKDNYGFCFLSNAGSGNVSIYVNQSLQLNLEQGKIYRYSYLFRVFEDLTQVTF
ncbi:MULTISPECIES: hypothetical protein [unclassified Chryseobacterium]|uniref:hypothetical protein n=1 Tax=unclassified Chryseobacterium TaxID=2593645 RepID=UPI00226A0926|nr:MULTISPECIES: hypothetical protein [unclassified Chryseobacterium]